jgi:NAD-dependent dihydropyrimidine dehydrogenase PreA subunit
MNHAVPRPGIGPGAVRRQSVEERSMSEGPRDPDAATVTHECKAAAGQFVPEVDRGACEGKAACESVCPVGVFEVGRITDADFRALSFLARLKSRAHGRRTAYTPNASRCEACGLCVDACPEGAIHLLRRADGGPRSTQS